MQKQLHQHDVIFRLEALQHERKVLGLFDPADDIIQIAKHCPGTLALLKARHGAAHVSCIDQPFKLRINGLIVLAAHFIHKLLRLVALRLVMQVMEQTAPNVLFLKTRQHVHVGDRKQLIDHARQELSVLIAKIQLFQILILIIYKANLIKYLDHV